MSERSHEGHTKTNLELHTSNSSDIPISPDKRKHTISRGGAWVRRALQYPMSRLRNRKSSELIHTDIEPTEVGKKLLSTFQKNLQAIQPYLEMNHRKKEQAQGKRPVVAVVVALHEEDTSLVTAKVFSKALSNLIHQAASANIDLDFIAVANNGGGTTEAAGQGMIQAVTSKFQEVFDRENLCLTESSEPEGEANLAVPWKVSLPLAGDRVSGKNRGFFIKQPRDKNNAGKLRALRDISNALHNEIINGYTPDAVFQMDAETILEYQDYSPARDQSPFQKMYETLKSKPDLIAVGTKDRLEPIAPDTGEPIGSYRPIVQETFMAVHKNRFLAIPGGSMLAEPDYYVAGMKAISEIALGDTAEDILFTQMMKAYAKTQQSPIHTGSLSIITHLNKSPQGKEAIDQLLRWKRQSAAINQIFPAEKEFDDRLNRYILTAIKVRLKDALKRKGGYWRQVAEDIRSLPEIVDFIRDKELADMLQGKPSWRNNNTN